jgi:hypothetical protein
MEVHGADALARPGRQCRAADKWWRVVLRIPSPELCQPGLRPIRNTLTLTFGQNSGDISTGPLTLLGTGKALLAGGKPKYGSVTGVSLLYDPSTNRWLLTGNLPPRSGHTLTRLQNGLVLAVGRRRPSPAFLPAPNSTCRSALARETSPQSARLASCVGRATGPC